MNQCSPMVAIPERVPLRGGVMAGHTGRQGRYSYAELYNGGPNGTLGSKEWFHLRYRDRADGFMWHYSALANSPLHATRQCLQDGDWHGHFDRVVVRVERWVDMAPVGAEDADDDPQCVCGAYRSEHALCGCKDGFQTAEEWASEREFIRSLDDDEYERIYGWDGGWS